VVESGIFQVNLLDGGLYAVKELNLFDRMNQDLE